jgi:hypothetical protein
MTCYACKKEYNWNELPKNVDPAGTEELCEECWAELPTNV